MQTAWVADSKKPHSITRCACATYHAGVTAGRFVTQEGNDVATLEDIERKIADLKSLAADLRWINRQCPGNGAIADCRILEALSPSNFNGK